MTKGNAAWGSMFVATALLSGGAIAAPLEAPKRGGLTFSRERRVNRATIAPLSLFAFGTAFEYERAITDKIAVHAGPVVSFADVATRLLGAHYFGFDAVAGARWFPLERDLAPSGLWFGPEVSLGLHRYSSIFGPSRSVIAGEVMAMGGYTLIVPGGLTASAGLGLGVAGDSDSLPHPAAALHMNVGFAW